MEQNPKHLATLHAWSRSRASQRQLALVLTVEEARALRIAVIDGMADHAYEPAMQEALRAVERRISDAMVEAQREDSVTLGEAMRVMRGGAW